MRLTDADIRFINRDGGTLDPGDPRIPTDKEPGARPPDNPSDAVMLLRILSAIASRGRLSEEEVRFVRDPSPGEFAPPGQGKVSAARVLELRIRMRQARALERIAAALERAGP